MIDARIVKRLSGVRGGTPFELNVHVQSSAAVTVILGPSGAGKTLILNCLAGFMRPDEGRILVQDELFFDAQTRVHVPPERRRCGYIFQDHTVFPHMSVLGNLQFAAQSMARPRLRGKERQKALQGLLEAFELQELASHMPHQLSGGQKQRVAIARALVGKPRLLLLDEPTRGLNLQLREAFYEVLRRAQERLEAPIVLVTHDVEECFGLADTLYFLENGRCLQWGKKDEVVRKPASLEVVGLLGIHTVAEAEILFLDPGKNVSRLRMAGQTLETQYLRGHFRGDRGWLCVRRNELRVLPPSFEAQPNQIVVEWQRARTTVHGVHLDFDGGLSADVSEAEFADLRGSARVRLEFPRDAVHFVAN